jgi:hypothetical protein
MLFQWFMIEAKEDEEARPQWEALQKPQSIAPPMPLSNTLIYAYLGIFNCLFKLNILFFKLYQLKRLQ